MAIDSRLVEGLYQDLDETTRARVDEVVDGLCSIKEENGRVCVVTGSGPNLHEGVTTLIAELIRKGVVDGVSTSSAVVAHEMAGCLERVLRVGGEELGIDPGLLPADGKFEITLCDDGVIESISREIDVDIELIRRARELRGDVIIKAAGNMSYPVGFRTERISQEVCAIAESSGLPFEEVAGTGSDEMTMIGAGAEKGVPVLVTVPQLVGGGSVGMDIADSTGMRERSRRIADLLAGSDMIIESALALAQEVHDGPFETYTGHGIWSGWEGDEVYRLLGKKLVRIDLDPNLELAWQKERESKEVQEAVAKGLPKTKLMGIPFRMEMSGFARLPGSLPIVGDIGRIWPIIGYMSAERLGVKLDFMSYPQETGAGKSMRDWIVDRVKILDRDRMLAVR